jgi:hypothetical protein
MIKPTIKMNEIDGMGSNGYLSVVKETYSEGVLEGLVLNGTALDANTGQFENSYCVQFPDHFRNFVDTK